VKVLIAGGTGLVGSALVNIYKKNNHDVVSIDSKIINLLDEHATKDFIKSQKPDLIIDAAAKVGGISINMETPSEFLSNNLRIQCNLMDAAVENRIEKFVFLGSSCIYPRDCPQPIREEYLMTGPLERSNAAYAIAKIAGLEAIKAARKQFGLNWISVMPTNVYGPHDNFNLQNGHVLPALIRRFIEAKENDSKTLTLWGSGNALREFIHSQDLAQAIFFVEGIYSSDDHINVGTGEDLRIKDLAELIANQVGFQGIINWDIGKPDGTPRKLLDVSKIRQLGWRHEIDLTDGIGQTIEWFLDARARNLARL
jgi:GDP-L-fucose synthase